MRRHTFLWCDDVGRPTMLALQCLGQFVNGGKWSEILNGKIVLIFAPRRVFIGWFALRLWYLLSLGLVHIIYYDTTVYEACTMILTKLWIVLVVLF